MPVLSVVMPVYNKVATLSYSLTCLYRQTYRDFEIIAVDDGSTDGSLEILQHAEARGLLRLLQRDEPGPGGYAARNEGAQHARGEWLVFFDADDLVLFDHLSRFASAICAHPGLDLFINAYQKIERDRRLPQVALPAEGVMSRREALGAFARCDFIHMNGACIRRDRFLLLGGFPASRYRRGGDVYFWLKALSELDAIHYDPAVTSLWQLQHSGVTRDLRNLGNLHPAVDLLATYSGRLCRNERHQLHAAVNRKLLSWAVEKKRHGQSVTADLAALRWDGMSLRSLYHLISLLLPDRFFTQMHPHSRRMTSVSVKEDR
ncbi:glycosyltransferase family A protein [Halomonas ventosae]|uniref:Glycosyl transferase family 2 n=1 Tax=Halomonas ventosae TaxID=229007 RepID=A0A2T0VL04_9GAMM|nr:glycosyltransferase family A protein [Halomonas ventosae]PRY70907.1 glycosyl transferase family 2 [Halomonas ventosae]